VAEAVVEIQGFPVGIGPDSRYWGIAVLSEPLRACNHQKEARVKKSARRETARARTAIATA
jgi:hypothetical protein